MVAITSSHLAAISALCALFLAPTADAAAVRVRRSALPAKKVPSGKAPLRDDRPTLPLPISRKSSHMKSKPKDSDKKHKKHNGESKEGGSHKSDSKEHKHKENVESRAERWEAWTRSQAQVPFKLRAGLARRDPDHVHEHLDIDEHIYVHDKHGHHHHHHHHNRGLDQRHHHPHHHHHHHHHHHSRRAVLIPNGSSKPFVVSHQGRSIVENTKREVQNSLVQRDDSVPGIVDIMSPDDAGAKRLASLFLDTSSNPYTLNADEKKRTAIYLSSSASSNVVAETSDTPVNLRLILDDMNHQRRVWYCATFDPTPSTPEPLTVEPCFEPSSSPPHKSQVFAYNSATGVVSPMWFKGDAAVASALSEDSPIANGSVACNGTAGNATLATRDETASQNGTSVTMVFVPQGERTESALEANTTTLESYSTSAAWSAASAPSEDTSTATLSSVLVEPTSTTDNVVNGLQVQVVATSPAAIPSQSAIESSAAIDAFEVASSIIANPEQTTFAEIYSTSSVDVSSTTPTATDSIVARAETPRPTVTPVKTEPYQWKFTKARKVLRAAGAL